MTSFRTFTLFTVVLFLGSAMLTLGCVSTTLQLSGNHPARPNADAGIAADPAGILRPDAALYAATEEVVQLQQPNGTAENPYVGHGIIREVQDGVLVIQHDAIPGFMTVRHRDPGLWGISDSCCRRIGRRCCGTRRWGPQSRGRANQSRTGSARTARG